MTRSSLGAAAALALAAALPGPGRADDRPARSGDKPAYLRVQVHPAANLDVGGQRTQSGGEVRLFETPPLPAGKTYRYTLFRAEICPPFEWRFVHHHPYPLDESNMMAAARAFEGEHDFTAFAASDDSDAERQSKVRTIFSSTLERSPGRLIYRVRGSGFLKHMVRNIVGALMEVGKGNLDGSTVTYELFELR